MPRRDNDTSGYQQRHDHGQQGDHHAAVASSPATSNLIFDGSRRVRPHEMRSHAFPLELKAVCSATHKPGLKAVANLKRPDEMGPETFR